MAEVYDSVLGFAQRATYNHAKIDGQHKSPLE